MLRDPSIRKAPEMVTRADPNCEDRYCQFSPVHASPLSTTQAIRLLDPVTIDPVEHLYFGELAPPALLGRVRDYFLIQYNDDASDGDSQENSDEYPSSDSSAGDMEDEFPDFLSCPIQRSLRMGRLSPRSTARLMNT
ncbi:hypothetical protein PIB30_071281 [Stylosanthes scabra]|uniref:Uncharacterized protein n=1 Tax=Stylosanthes scabra TaxID=79078 RepID=A0ABU6WM45_9FABA|nr:hypothetical protein [Stylosanthes scabra]